MKTTVASALLSASAMTPVERQMGRFMRAPDHPGGEGGGENNNPGDSGGGNNNDGNVDPLASFWGGETESSPAGGAAAQGGESQSQAPDFLKALTEMPVGEIFSDSALQKLGEGDFSEVNQNLQSTIRESNKQMFAQTVQLMSLFGERLVAAMEEKFTGTLESRDSSSFLETNFPSAKDPQIRPLVQTVFDQAMKNTKGNKPEAIKQTKEMLALMGKKTAADTGLNLDTTGESSPTGGGGGSWLDKLTKQLSQ